MRTRIGDVETKYSVRGIPSYQIELWHDGLKKHRLIKGGDSTIIRRKADLQSNEWDEKWNQMQTKETTRLSRETKKQTGVRLTEEAQKELDRLSNILLHTLDINDAINWEALKDSTQYPEPKPKRITQEVKPTKRKATEEPKRNQQKYQPKFGILDKIFASRREKIENACNNLFISDHEAWKQEILNIEIDHAAAVKDYEEALQMEERAYQRELRKWEGLNTDYIKKQISANAVIDKMREDYVSGIPEIIIEYCDMVLSASDYPDYFPKEFAIDYNNETKILLVDYTMPAPEHIPTLKEVKYIQARDELVEQHLSQTQLLKLYDDILYNIVLRTVHELFESDVINAIDTVVFNGWVKSLDRSTGKDINPCVMSLQVRRNEFLAINLANVDPKACFKSLKGVGSSKLHSLAAVPPIMQMRREDGRFVSAYEVANTLDPSINLAAMDWEDFEHLIREIFEKEFSVNGGEVKVTQASRDGGVDAVAFDPDPIRGGKIVIQAKRYTNTVGVGAVRDLYGTVMNEGANKGILVTTSDYGPDSYEFAKGKPMILLNGANLLHMLEKHGHKAKIDIPEARKLAMSQAAL
ncbi:restriction endonuclease [Geobacter pelophilus]|uniref:Restriction endonuclease n=1 Tax=Geoanaerobacter pelophilus TaxID=60036 RepID=A0AAW4L8Q0_9BACT|nr:restriction endonuclease [Geoanaerobacter pelophilus]MBT0664207.1 restriction endonuclease [Geoanaerobacter pelophilus]